MKKLPNEASVPHLNIGCTSFIVKEDYVPAVRACTRYARDISLLLLEAGAGGEWLPTSGTIRELKAIADGEGITWNVHLPTDGGFSSPSRARKLTDNVLRAIDLTRVLNPHTWVMHVVTNPEPSAEMRPPMTPEERALALASLERIGTALPSPRHLALENLERHPLDYLDELMEATDFSRCFDIGHVWKEDERPETLLLPWLERIRMCHLHGLHKRDHQSLHHLPAERLDALLHLLWRQRFDKLLTIEVFSVADYLNSCRAIRDSYERYQNMPSSP